MKGRSLDSAKLFQEELVDFWGKYSMADPSHPFFAAADRNKSEWSRSIPVAIHGDEGRGRQKQPVMVLAYQPLLPIKGQKTTMKKFPGLTSISFDQKYGDLLYFSGFQKPICSY